jgi:ribonucleoside-diphosphate reductase alpha subunit
MVRICVLSGDCCSEVRYFDRNRISFQTCTIKSLWLSKIATKFSILSENYLTVVKAFSLDNIFIFQTTMTDNKQQQLSFPESRGSINSQREFPDSRSVNSQREFPMYVIKRSGERARMSYDAIHDRLYDLCQGLDASLTEEKAFRELTLGIHKKVVSGMTTADIDRVCADDAAAMASIHPDYDKLAGRISVSNNHKETEPTFSAAMKRAYDNYDYESRQHAPLIAKSTLEFVTKHAHVLDAAIQHHNDYKLTRFAMCTLERSYLLRRLTGVRQSRVIERYQYMLMRTAVGIHIPLGRVVPTKQEWKRQWSKLKKRDKELFTLNDTTTDEEALQHILETYDLLSRGAYIHATPTLQDAGRDQGQLASCFLMTLQEDSIEGLNDTTAWCNSISKYAGGIGLSLTPLRAADAYIKGRAGRAAGIMGYLRVLNMQAQHISQGGGKRKGSFAVYLEPWHADIYAFLGARNADNDESLRALDLFYGLWVPQLFWDRVESDGMWSLFCPSRAPKLLNVWGDEFNANYVEYERQGVFNKQVRARDLLDHIVKVQMQVGLPYVLNKDACNRKSNQQNLGTINCSNLCTEIIEYSSPDEIAVCNLASLSLPFFIKTRADGTREFDYDLLYRVARVVTFNLNKVIEHSFYPLVECKRSNFRHRPIGIGVQGMADLLTALRIPFESEEANDINVRIFKTMYFASLTESNAMCIKDPSKVYSSFKGSPASKGILQFDMWGEDPTDQHLSWDWDTLRQSIVTHGMANSLLIAPMPTATSSQFLGNHESFEPFTNNIYVRRVLSGEFVCFNAALVQDLTRVGLWNQTMREKIMASNGSVQWIEEIPADIRALYKTVYEISQPWLMKMSRARAPYIDQTQSYNVYFDNEDTMQTFKQLRTMMIQGAKMGLKTLMYYIRQTAAHDANKVAISPAILRQYEAYKQAKNERAKSEFDLATVPDDAKDTEADLAFASVQGLQNPEDRSTRSASFQNQEDRSTHVQDPTQGLVAPPDDDLDSSDMGCDRCSS